MIKLLRFWDRNPHLRAEEASALVDGELPAAGRAASHVAACEDCRALVDEMARLREMLAALPEAEAPRSFRLRASDVAAPASARSAGGIGLVPRLLPYVSAAAAAVFVVAMTLQYYPDGGAGSDAGDGDGLTMGAPAQPTGNLRAEDAASAPAGADDGAAGGTAAAPATAPEPGDTPAAAGATVPDASPAADGAQRDAPETGAAPDAETFDSDGGATESAAPPDATDAVVRDDGDGGVTTPGLIAIVAAGVAVVAGAGAVIARTRRGT